MGYGKINLRVISHDKIAAARATLLNIRNITRVPIFEPVEL